MEPRFFYEYDEQTNALVVRKGTVYFLSRSAFGFLGPVEPVQEGGTYNPEEDIIGIFDSRESADHYIYSQFYDMDKEERESHMQRARESLAWAAEQIQAVQAGEQGEAAAHGFNIRNTENTGFLELCPGSWRNPRDCELVLHVWAARNGRRRSWVLKTGSEREMLSYLGSETAPEEFVDLLVALSNRVDNYVLDPEEEKYTNRYRPLAKRWYLYAGGGMVNCDALTIGEEWREGEGEELLGVFDSEAEMEKYLMEYGKE